ncbi:APH(3') family aminoglycoside O-phosphotransferase [Sciscionella marina]|uniref:APH(3') family aminoglycoside O-phosphotransferase n=1 Tax=Sciscionella marina TaxID=508770 RepID=UPI0003788CF2|nr:APH(3') family aminoglycoside O-phosphotransferase [Sciscionella marina]
MWEEITTGMSGARVQRGTGAYRKSGPDCAAEVERLIWLRGLGFPAPEVLDSGPGWFEMRAVAGRTADQWWPEHLRAAVVDALADLARDLHAITECPFDASLAVTVPRARAAVTEGRIDLADLDEHRSGWSAAELLAELEATLPDCEDLVLTHGDLCLPNVVLDPETTEVTGILDVGRLGLADRYADLALTTRSLADELLNPAYGPAASARFLGRYGVAPDSARLEFYRLLDEFF